MDISCGFAPSAAAPDLVAAAEQLGYRRAWMYDSARRRSASALVCSCRAFVT
jgi:alkanesulfonate monooxygenase SsuD/methylene tetrahydromethanopterin reductase-like flavin-dependent oxidoreductase (luciferase family)